MSTTGAGTSLRGISTRINGRHAFVHERVLELIARETKASGSVDFSKAELAERMGCCVRSLDRALTRLRREGLVVSTPVFNKVGGPAGKPLYSNARRHRAGTTARSARFEEVTRARAHKNRGAVALGVAAPRCMWGRGLEVPGGPCGAGAAKGAGRALRADGA